ncbi:MAG: sulfotransferase, partial [Bdellovibrionales bacterium]|nr:sulfotransferase [Bdellovibrionales bacterium]
LLKRLFPEAEFIHITRAPTAFIPSTIRLWEALDRTNALEDRVDTQRITEFVFGCYASMYGDFFSSWPKPLTRGHFELRYDELASNGEAALQALYEGLSLSGWGQMKPKVEAELRVRKDYVPNTHLLEDSLARRIQVECAEYLNYYRY